MDERQLLVLSIAGSAASLILLWYFSFTGGGGSSAEVADGSFVSVTGTLTRVVSFPKSTALYLVSGARTFKAIVFEGKETGFNSSMFSRGMNVKVVGRAYKEKNATVIFVSRISGASPA